MNAAQRRERPPVRAAGAASRPSNDLNDDENNSQASPRPQPGVVAAGDLAEARIEVVCRELRHGSVRVGCTRSERELWAQLGLTLRQRDGIIERLVERGEARVELGPDGAVQAVAVAATPAEIAP